jgi:hypothetical protein
LQANKLQHKLTSTATMQFSLALFAILSAAVQAGPMDTCGEQADCLDFTIEEVTGTTCAGDCDFKVCMTVNQGGSCTKTGAISHTCEKPDTGCTTNGGGFDGMLELVNIGDGYTSCQIVTAGDTAEFLMKDGGGNCGAKLTSGVTTCQHLEEVYPENGSCTGNTGMECIWMVEVPASCGGGGGTDTDNRIGTASDPDAPYLCS